MRRLRQEMQMVFQDPFSSLDPRQTVSQLISEPIIEHKLLSSKADIDRRTLELMETVGLAERYVNVYPHELDGGRRQRIASPARLRSIPSSSSATSLCLRWTCPFRRRYSTCSSSSSATWA